MKIDLLNGANLAFIGDAYINLYIREYLIKSDITNSKKLHNLCIKYLSAKGHDKIVKKISGELTEEEQNIFKRGRNYKYQSYRKNIDQTEYLNSSGFEAVIGYLYLKEDKERLEYLLKKAIMVIEENDE